MRFKSQLDLNLTCIAIRYGWEVACGFALGFLIWAAPATASTNCGELLQSLNSTLEAKSAQDLKDRFNRLPKNLRDRYDPRIDAQRLVNPEDWERAQAALPDSPDLVYGRQSIEQWQVARSTLSKLAGREPSESVVREIHETVMRGHAYHGYEGRRILQRFERGEIDETTKSRLLEMAYKENTSVSGTDHSKLGGRYRSVEIDDVKHKGSSIDERGNRYFTTEELAAVRANKYMRVDNDSVVKIADGKYRAVSYYTQPSKIDVSMRRMFADLQKDLKSARNDDDVIIAVARMQKSFVAIHPFLDGNGRSVRLLSDFIFQSRGLPPPLLLRESELIQSESELAAELKHGMRLYLEAKEKLIQNITRSSR